MHIKKNVNVLMAYELLKILKKNKKKIAEKIKKDTNKKLKDALAEVNSSINILNYAISNEYKDLEKERVNIIAQSTYETIINQVEEKCINSEKDYISRGNYKRSIGQNEDAIVEYDKAISLLFP